MVFPTRESLESILQQMPVGRSPSADGRTSQVYLDEDAAWWSKRLRVRVKFARPGEMFLALSGIEVLSTGDRCMWVLYREKPGWICFNAWLEIKPVTPEYLVSDYPKT